MSNTPAPPPGPTPPATSPAPVPRPTPPATEPAVNPLATDPAAMSDEELAAANVALTAMRQGVLARQRALLAEAADRKRRRRVSALEAELAAHRGVPQVVGPGRAVAPRQVPSPGKA